MREHKYRGFNKREGWAYGDLVHRNGETCIHFYTAEHGECLWGVDPESVGQYTGLTDKNGVKIFAGDICKDARGFRFVVVWDDDNARFLGRGIGAQREYIRYVGQIPAVEAIGNMHDNQDMLKESD